MNFIPYPDYILNDEEQVEINGINKMLSQFNSFKLEITVKDLLAVNNANDEDVDQDKFNLLWDCVMRNGKLVKENINHKLYQYNGAPVLHEEKYISLNYFDGGMAEITILKKNKKLWDYATELFMETYKTLDTYTLP